MVGVGGGQDWGKDVPQKEERLKETGESIQHETPEWESYTTNCTYGKLLAAEDAGEKKEVC